MTTPDTIILCVSIALLIAPLAYLAGRWCGANHASASRCCACGTPTPGVKCDQCADLKPEQL